MAKGPVFRAVRNRYGRQEIPLWCSLPLQEHRCLGGCWGIAAGEVYRRGKKYCLKCEDYMPASEEPPADLVDGRSDEQKLEDRKAADSFAPPGTLKHFMLSMGFYAKDDETAAEILTRIILEREWYSQKYSDLRTELLLEQMDRKAKEDGH